MNYIRDLKGDSKADWLWNRIGEKKIFSTLDRSLENRFPSWYSTDLYADYVMLSILSPRHSVCADSAVDNTNTFP